MNRNHSQTQAQKKSPPTRPHTPTTTQLPEIEPSAAANQAKQFLSPDAPHILALQRTMGNKAIQRLIAQRQSKAQRHWMPGEPEEVQAMPAIQRHWMPGEPEEVQAKRAQREASEDERQETPDLPRVALSRGFGVPGHLQRRAMLRETVSQNLWGNAAATRTIQAEKKEEGGSDTQTPAVFTGPITFDQTELPADGKAIVQGVAKWTPPTRAVKWGFVGNDYGSTVTDTGQVKVGDNTQGNESVKLQVKAEDAADGSAFTTGFMTLYEAKFFQAKLDFPKFAAATHSFPNFTIGLNGKFDMDYQPAAQRADATIKVKFAFPDEDLSKMGMGQIVSTIISQIERQQKFISQIAAQWSGRYQFKNVREPQSIWGKLNPVDVKVNVIPVTSGQHFTVNLYSKTKGRANVGGGQVHMFAGSDVPKPAFNPGTAQGELTRVRRNTPTPILFANNSADVPGDAAAKLQFLGTYLSRIHNPKFDVTIVGHASATGQKTHNEKLSEQRAQNVSAILTGAGAGHHKIQPSGVGQAGADATEQWRKVEITSDTPPGWQNMQDTTAHEFGHMIGLGDEYMGDDPTQTLATHHALVAKAFGKDYADQVAKRGDTDYASVMEGGDDVRIQHYVTFWSALAEATQKAALPDPKFGYDDWKFIG
ncbi:MAG: OmpA family protein [Chloroflexi bacterium]|nr:OmpA family protein [Chloroflexota bacterium]